MSFSYVANDISGRFGLQHSDGILLDLVAFGLVVIPIQGVQFLSRISRDMLEKQIIPDWQKVVTALNLTLLMLMAFVLDSSMAGVSGGRMKEVFSFSHISLYFHC